MCYVGMNVDSFKIVLEMINIFSNKFMKWFGILCGFLKFIFYKKGAKISWLHDVLQIFSRKIGAQSGTKFTRNLATTKF